MMRGDREDADKYIWQRRSARVGCLVVVVTASVTSHTPLPVLVHKVRLWIPVLVRSPPPPRRPETAPTSH